VRASRHRAGGAIERHAVPQRPRRDRPMMRCPNPRLSNPLRPLLRTPAVLALPGSPGSGSASTPDVRYSARTRLLPLMILAAALICAGPANEPSVTPLKTAPHANDVESTIHFRAVDIFLNPGDKPLGAYQVELKAKNKDVE